MCAAANLVIRRKTESVSRVKRRVSEWDFFVNKHICN